MIDGRRVLVMILARSGSTGVKDKNIADLNGRPVLWYSISEAQKSRYADAICVSTDSPTYAKIAEEAGVPVPFLRPPELAAKTTTAAESSRWSTLKFEECSGVRYDYIVEFMCTNPFKTAADLDACVEKLHRTGADSVVAVARLWDHHPRRIKRIEDDEIKDWEGCPEVLESLRQDLQPPAFIRCGSVYALARRTLIDEKNRRGRVSRPHIMPPERVINIDEPRDLELARLLMSRPSPPRKGAAARILVTANLDGAPDVLEALRSLGEADYRPRLDCAELALLAPAYDAFFVSTQLRIGEEVLRAGAGGRLKVVCTASTGRDHIDLEAARRLGVEVLSITKDVEVLKTITSTAEHAFGLMLALARKSFPAFEHVKAGDWDYTPFIGLELNGKTAGIVGFGRLGTIFARYCRAFYMNVAAYDPHVTIADPEVRQVPVLETLLRESDFVALHVHLSAETRHMIGARELSQMKKTAHLINTSRGGVLDQTALVAALEKGLIAGAALDVIEGEVIGSDSGSDASRQRLIDYARRRPNLLITSHLGGMSDGGRRKGFGLAARKLGDHLAALAQGGLPKEHAAS